MHVEWVFTNTLFSSIIQICKKRNSNIINKISKTQVKLSLQQSHVSIKKAVDSISYNNTSFTITNKKLGYKYWSEFTYVTHEPINQCLFHIQKQTN